MTATAPQPRSRRFRLPLRLRVTVTFIVISLLLTGMLSVATYLVVRSYLLGNREQLATRQAFLNARVAKSQLLSGETAPAEIVSSLGSGAGGQILLNVAGRWFSSAVAIDPAQLPSDLQAETASGNAARERFSIAGVPHLAIAVPLAAAGATYVEVVPLRELERTLGTIAAALAVVSAAVIALGAIAGWLAARRLFRPFAHMSAVAVAISRGRYDQRLDDDGDRDLTSFANSFNGMVDGLQHRIERETRFASEVSHELRTPLTALSTALEVVRRRSGELPERMRPPVEVIESQVEYFERLVLDLLEISRLDAGADKATPEPVDLHEFVDRLAELLATPAPVVEGDGPWDASVDKRRLERVLANLIENANVHGGGVTALRLARDGDLVRVSVEDQGPGIPIEHRAQVFERFWRGVAARQGEAKGTGLGMALVTQHLRLLGGTVRIESNDGGGTRVVVELPAAKRLVVTAADR